MTIRIPLRAVLFILYTAALLGGAAGVAFAVTQTTEGPRGEQGPPGPRGLQGPQGITQDDLRAFVWLKPKIVCQVDFVEWTVDNHLRHPKFTGLREDKDASEVVRET